MNNKFKASLVIAPHPPTHPPARHCDTLCTEINMSLIPKLISECTPNSNFSANHEDNENDQDNENHPDNENESNYPANKYMFKVDNREKVVMFLWLYLNIFHNLF